MDGRWVLVMLGVAVLAAIRLGRHASPSERPPADKPALESQPPKATKHGRLPTGGAPDEQLDGELDAALDRVWAEHAGGAGTLLEARLRQLVDRGVPARAIRRAPGGRAVRVAFADGTVLLCRGTGHGDFGRLGLALLHHSVRLGGYAHDVNGTRLEFRWSPDQRLAAVAVGLDQPD